MPERRLTSGLQVGQEPLPAGEIEGLLAVEGPVRMGEEIGRRERLALGVDRLGPGLAAVLREVEVVAEPGSVRAGIFVETEDQRGPVAVVDGEQLDRGIGSDLLEEAADP